jgi:hypothetical protein
MLDRSHRGAGAVVMRRVAARQRDGETRTTPLAAFAADEAVVRLHDGAADRQAEADAGRGAFLGATLELLEDDDEGMLGGRGSRWPQDRGPARQETIKTLRAAQFTMWIISRTRG